ncbi:MAG: methylenetetrahydrofolate reductase [Planctomycetota bacterium]
MRTARLVVSSVGGAILVKNRGDRESGDFPRLVLEVVPPPLRRGEEGLESRLQHIGRIHRAVNLDAVNIPEIRAEESKHVDGERRNPYEPRWESRVLGQLIQDRLGLPAIVNRVVVHASNEENAAWFRDSFVAFGIRKFVIVGGEKSNATYPGPSVCEANRLFPRWVSDSAATFGNISIPGRRSRERVEAARMADKVAAGARFFTTQIIYRARELTELLDDLKAAGDAVASTPVLVSLCPLRSRQSIKMLHFLGVRIDTELVEKLCRVPERTAEHSVEHILSVVDEILAHQRRTNSPTPLGFNVAPVGPVPVVNTIALCAALQRLLRT